MLILAFETSAKAAGAALHDGKKLLAEAYQNTGLTQSQTLMVMAEDLLKQCFLTVQRCLVIVQKCFHNFISNLLLSEFFLQFVQSLAFKTADIAA